MTRFVQNDHLGADGIKILELTISDTSSGFTWSYSSKRIITGKSATPVEVKLVNNTSADVAIVDYASTGVSDLHSPIAEFELNSNQQLATFLIELYPRQLIDFGLFVSVKPAGEPPIILFCDPQASNDPIVRP